MDGGSWDLPLLSTKDYSAPSLFRPADLLREARRQKGLPDTAVPSVALLDPDGDIVRHLADSGRGRRHPGWACFHTEMWTSDLDGVDIGVVGRAVGAPFAVLVAEQLAASGADLVISVTSAGQVAPLQSLPRFVLIDRALRDEGTSAHYMPPARWSSLDDELGKRLIEALERLPEPVRTGAAWTTDAPYRETAAAIAAARAEGITCVEMEAAALYAYGAARRRAVVCLAHITNTTGTTATTPTTATTATTSTPTAGDDFDKGDHNGVHEALAIVRTVALALRPH